ncbi:hypothetical protein J4Q44_G00379700 [Coregonus suidteri]|uniref:Uncharacterized protein n=1 Tax=Coregonus suidteri TaxID=861788 RepID=A0AAN8KN71_9TELE
MAPGNKPGMNGAAGFQKGLSCDEAAHRVHSARSHDPPGGARPVPVHDERGACQAAGQEPPDVHLADQPSLHAYCPLAGMIRLPKATKAPIKNRSIPRPLLATIVKELAIQAPLKLKAPRGAPTPINRNQANQPRGGSGLLGKRPFDSSGPPVPKTALVLPTKMRGENGPVPRGERAPAVLGEKCPWAGKPRRALCRTFSSFGFCLLKGPPFRSSQKPDPKPASKGPIHHPGGWGTPSFPLNDLRCLWPSDSPKVENSPAKGPLPHHEDVCGEQAMYQDGAVRTFHTAGYCAYGIRCLFRPQCHGAAPHPPPQHPPGRTYRSFGVWVPFAVAATSCTLRVYGSGSFSVGGLESPDIPTLLRIRSPLPGPNHTLRAGSPAGPCAAPSAPLASASTGTRCRFQHSLTSSSIRAPDSTTQGVLQLLSCPCGRALSTASDMFSSSTLLIQLPPRPPLDYPPRSGQTTSVSPDHPAERAPWPTIAFTFSCS